MVLVLLDRVNSSLTGFDFMLELNLRALLSLPVRQHLMKLLNIYGLKVVYLLLSGVLWCGHEERRLALCFPQQCPPLFCSFHFHSHWINEGEDKRETLLKTKVGRLHPGITCKFTYFAKSWIHSEKMSFTMSCYGLLAASLDSEYYSTL